jgi:hypothetical protein
MTGLVSTPCNDPSCGRYMWALWRMTEAGGPDRPYFPQRPFNWALRHSLMVRFGRWLYSALQNAKASIALVRSGTERPVGTS